MSDQIPSQAEGEPDDDPKNPAHTLSPPHPTPSQAEGERDDENTPQDATGEPGPGP